MTNYYEDNEILFYKEWLQAEKDCLKMLVFIGAHANKDTMTFEIKKKAMREWFGQSNKNSTDTNIKVLNRLQDNGHINFEDKGQRLNISLNKDKLSEYNQIHYIQKQWIKTIIEKKIETGISVDWIQSFNLLVSIHIGKFKSGDIYSQDEIRAILGVSSSTVGLALKLINACDFRNNFFQCYKETEKEYIKIGNYGFNRNIGTRLICSLNQFNL